MGAFQYVEDCRWHCAGMYLDPREFACIHTHKYKRSFLRACSRTGLIKTQNAFVHKNCKIQTHFGFRNFQDVLLVCLVGVVVRRYNYI